MSDPINVLLLRLLPAGVMFAIALLIRWRGPVGLVKHVDWTRVSDPQALGAFTSLMLSAIGGLIAAHGIAYYLWRDDAALRDASNIAFLFLLAFAVAAQWLGQRRYQDKPRGDEQR